MRSGSLTRTIDLMVTPRVVEEVRRHFNCSDLEGAELEDQGGDGTALTHWEKRIFQNEAMTGTVHTENPVYSRLTFALLEDSGWYLPNYEMVIPCESTLVQQISYSRPLSGPRFHLGEKSGMRLYSSELHGLDRGQREGRRQVSLLL